MGVSDEAMRQAVFAMKRCRQESGNPAWDKHIAEVQRIAAIPHMQPAGEAVAVAGSRLHQLWCAMYRMFNHGRDNNTVSAQCEVQLLREFLAGRDVAVWNHPIPTPGDTTPPPDPMLQRVVEVLEEAEDFVDRHSEPWYRSGQALLSRIRAALADLSPSREVQ